MSFPSTVEPLLSKLESLSTNQKCFRLSSCAGNDLDSIRALFSEKEKELSLAVAKVEALTRQLEELRRDRRGLSLITNNGNNQQPASPAARELEKLRRELMVNMTTKQLADLKAYLTLIPLFSFCSIATNCLCSKMPDSICSVKPSSSGRRSCAQSTNEYWNCKAVYIAKKLRIYCCNSNSRTERTYQIRPTCSSSSLRPTFTSGTSTIDAFVLLQ